jgi:hypothetical protein
MRAIYVPIFDRFFESSIMYEDLTTRFVMLALIRLAYRSGANGEVDMDPRLFAQSINVPLADVERAIARLMEPDPSSHSPDEDGRRLMPIDPARPFRGWRLVNWEKYRILVNRINDAARKRDEYHSKKNDTPKVSESLHHSPEVSDSLHPSPESANLSKNSLRDETRRDETIRIKRERFAPPSLDELQRYMTEKGYTFDAEAFVAYYEARGWKLNGKTPASWKAMCVTWQKRETPTKAAYPSPAAIHDFGKPLVGLNVEEWKKRFQEHFGVEYRP